MKIHHSILLYTSFNLLSIGLPQALHAAPTTPQRIALLDFQTKGGVTPEEASVLSQRIRALLSQSNTYDLLEREALTPLLKEQGFQQSLYSDCDSACTETLGKLLNVDAFVMGGVSRVGNLYVLSARLVNVRQGTIVKDVFYDCACSFEAVLNQGTRAISQQLLSPRSSDITAIPPGVTLPFPSPALSTDVSQNFAGSGWGGYRNDSLDTSDFNGPTALAQLPGGDLLVADSHNHVLRRLHNGKVSAYSGGRWNPWIGEWFGAFRDGTAPHARFHHPTALAVNAQGITYVADTNNHRIRKILPNGDVISFVGTGEPGYNDGNPAVAQFRRPQGLALGPDGSLYVADTDNHAIRKVSPHGEVSTLSGNGHGGFEDGPLPQARFRYPTALTLGTHNGQSVLYVADSYNHAVRRIGLPQHKANGRRSLTAQVSTLAGNGHSGFAEGPGSDSRWNQPSGLCQGQDTLYVTDKQNHRIRQIRLSTGVVNTLAGTGQAGYVNGNAAVGQFNQPTGLWCDPQGHFLLVVDTANHRLRKVLLNPSH